MCDTQDLVETDSFTVGDTEARERIDRALACRYAPAQSRQYFQKLIEEGMVLVNGHPVKKRALLSFGDQVEISFHLTPEITLTPEAIPLDLLYEDAHLLAVAKPPGMVVHPAPGHWTGTFANALAHHCGPFDGAGDALRPGIVHRLDKDTSGVLLAAKTASAHQQLVALFQQRAMHKEYLAICVGSPGDGELSAAIGRHPVHRKQMAVVEAGGRPAVTHYTTLASAGGLSIVRLTLVTGRTHQARVHMRHLGHPILGDPVYGNSGLNAQHGLVRQMLHAYQLSFQHPVTGQLMALKAPIPQDMLCLAQRISPCVL